MGTSAWNVPLYPYYSAPTSPGCTGTFYMCKGIY